jgi:two-component system LytT family response regulator
MPGMDGFDILDALNGDSTVVLPRIVFTTAYDSYAIRAFEINAVDYLLKPFTAERLHSAVERAKQQIQMPEQPSAENGAGDSSEKYARPIVFKSRGRILFLPVSDIRWIAAEENYVRLCTESEAHLLRETMVSCLPPISPAAVRVLR